MSFDNFFDTFSLTENPAFSKEEISGVYKAISLRRDMRHFSKNSTIDDEVLKRLLLAAHLGPSVGFMQPWRFLRIKNQSLRGEIAAIVEKERIKTSKLLGERQNEFLKLKVEGINECAALFAVCMEITSTAKHAFGRRTMPYMDIASVGCAIENLWLAARAENLGVGWVSVFDPAELGSLLNVPDDFQTVALLCIGAVDEFYEKPMLEQQKWAKRMPISEVVFDEKWGAKSDLLT